MDTRADGWIRAAIEWDRRLAVQPRPAMHGLEDVMVTYRRQPYVIRLVSPEPQILLLVILDRDRANLATARRAIRTFCASFAA